MINRECKIKPIHDYYRQYKDQEIIQYVGIAIDEPKRLARLSKNGKISKVSLLEKYGYTEDMARKKCAEYGLLSPIYRGGVGAAVGSVHQCVSSTLQNLRLFTLIYGVNLSDSARLPTYALMVSNMARRYRR